MAPDQPTPVTQVDEKRQIPVNRQRTRSLGYQRADGTFVMVPRAVRKSIVNLFDVANKANFSPADLQGILNHALDTAIQQGLAKTTLPEEG